MAEEVFHIIQDYNQQLSLRIIDIYRLHHRFKKKITSIQYNKNNTFSTLDFQI